MQNPLTGPGESSVGGRLLPRMRYAGAVQSASIWECERDQFKISNYGSRRIVVCLEELRSA